MRGGRAALAALAVLASVFLLVAAGSAGAEASKSIYIVQMLDAPAVAYSGGVAGLAATKPAKGEKIDPNDASVKQYVGYLHGQHDKAIQKVGGGGSDKLYDFDYSYNGFAASLTDEQANALQKQSGVLNVTKNDIVSIDTSTTPTFLGLTDPGGLWDQLGGPDGTKNGVGAGEDIVIGDIDSGIWPESRSFSDRDASGKLVYTMPGTRMWHGRDCHPGENFVASDCNRKLIGATWFNAAWGGDAAVESQRPWEFMSPRDYNGHGTHTASTAGGDHGVQPDGPAAALGKISGIAPRARIAVYKALWSTQDASTASGFTADLVAAIDQAVADGVDVINYSISGTSTNFLDPVEVAFLFAEDAGVFVSESAGNSGPTTGTVAHPGPWTTTVAAGTHNRNGVGSVTLGNGTTLNGASIAAPVGPAPLIDASAAALPGQAAAAALCFTAGDNGGAPALDPAKVNGKIVLCDRGVNARVNKSLAVRNAGGVGMILANTSPNSLNADFHFVPSVHISDTDRATVKAYIAGTANPTAKINQSTVTLTDPAPFTASFSSRGPLLAGGGDLLKPDVIAPGQDVLAAVAPPGQAGLNFNLLSGTSMSAPHVSGLGALLKQLHPSWTPMAIKSSLMTSAYDVLDTGVSTATRIFRQGAGHVKPNDAAHPGLVYDAGFNDFLAFLCGTTNGVSQATCTALKNAGYSTDPSNFNSPSIAIGDMAGVQTVTRKVRNVGDAAATYTASVSGLSGVSAVVSPSSLTLNPGETKSFTVTFTTAGAALNSYTGGFLTWTGAGHAVRSPIVIRPVALAAPAEVSGNGSPLSYNVTFGFSGPFGANALGLIPAATTAGTVADDPKDSFSPAGQGVTAVGPLTIPAGTTVARFQLFSGDASPGSDLDLYVYKGSTQVGSSGGGTAAEQVTLRNPAAGTDYTVYIHGFATAGNQPSPFKLYTWILGSTAAGNMTVTPDPTTATIGGTGAINLTFSGLAAGTKYLGAVVYTGTASATSPTIVRVDTP